MNRKYLLILILGCMTFLFSSCGVNSSIMFRTKNVDVISDDIPMSPSDAYRLAADDKISFILYTEDGKQIIDNAAAIDREEHSATNIEYLIRKDGQVELPMLSWVPLAGLSIIEAQEKLKELYGQYYNNPYIQIRVINRRVVVFPGSGSDAKVIALENENTTLMEAIALAGGITERGRAKIIKVMRMTDEGRKVYQVDLSTLDGLAYADMIVQSNDYIYIEPTKQLTKEFLKEVAPLVSLISSVIVVITVILSIK